jgi:hypothetical protein
MGTGMMLLMACLAAAPVPACDVVRGGRPMATIVIEPSEQKLRPAHRRKDPSAKWPSDRQAAEVLRDWVRKMTDAELPIAEVAPEQGAAIYVGAAAVKAGLRLDDIPSLSHEALRIQCDRRRVLVAGQNDTATLKAVCRLLEQWGCRYLLDHPLGEVYPCTPDLTLGKLDIHEKPGFLSRSLWGSNWSGMNLWKVWNGAGGVAVHCGHAWGSQVPKEVLQQHPEYTALRDGRRTGDAWYCTSNPDLRAAFARGVVEQLRRGATTSVSISPPDGRGYCQCEACRQQDDPQLREPSSGNVCVSNRYCDFYQDVARRVAQQNPEAILNFYCYADYTQAPSRNLRLEPNLCAWLAPIRYCRFHPIGHAGCPSRLQLAELVEAWATVAKQVGYRTYNYDLADVLVPFSMISVWKHDLPYLKQKGCLGINNETLANWQIYGPHIYLSARLAYDPDANADVIMDDYYRHAYGPRAAPFMKQYWTAIDRAFLDLPCHTGSVYALHLVYTPEFLGRCRALLDQAAAAAKSDPAHSARVALAAEGLGNAVQFCAIREAMNRGDFQQAKRVYEQLLGRSQAHAKSRLGHEYTVTYAKRFVGNYVLAGAEVAAPPRRVVAVLPDRWRLAYDERDVGVSERWHQPAFDDRGWQEVATYSRPLDAQGIPDRCTIMWYRTKFRLPEKSAKLVLFGTEIDGVATVYLNGQQVGAAFPSRKSFEVAITDAAVPGENTLAIRVDHSKMTELFLGGILRPVMVVEKQ